MTGANPTPIQNELEVLLAVEKCRQVAACPWLRAQTSAALTRAAPAPDPRWSETTAVAAM
jgi:hypothetical protein